MKVLGIDPGTAACGYGIVQESGGRLRATCHGWWRTSARERPEARLLTIFTGVQELIAQHAPDAVALEESYVGADARIALSVGQARGAVLVAAASVGVACTEYSPATVKQAVCGYGRADVRHHPWHVALRRPSLSWTIPYPQAAVPGSMPRTFTRKG